MEFVKLQAKNWLSFKELDYKFESKPILIQGRNLTEDDQESNGSGKSAIQAAIEKCVLDSTSRKVKDVDLIMFDEKSSELHLSIKCPVRKEVLIIERTITVKSGATLNLSINDSPVSFATLRDGNQFIIDWLGISREDIQNNFIINKERFISFFSSPNSKKIELINRFSNAQIISGIEDLVKRDVKSIEDEIKSKNSEINTINGSILTTEDLLVREKGRNLKFERDTKIKSLKTVIEASNQDIEEFSNKINGNKNFIHQNNLKLKGLNGKLNEAQNKITEFNIEPLTNQIHQIENKRSEKRSKLLKIKDEKLEYESVLDEATSNLVQIERNLKGTVACPNCKFEFVVGKEVDVKKEKELKNQIEGIITQAAETINNIDNKINSFTLKEINPLSDEEKKINEKIQDFNLKLQQVKKSISSINDDIWNLTEENNRLDKGIKTNENNIQESVSEIGNIKLKIQNLESEDVKNNPRIKELNDDIKKHRKDLKAKQDELTLIEDKLFKVTKWIYNFKKFRMHLAEKSIKIIEGYCNKYLVDMKSDIRIKLEGFKLKADGDIKEEITPYVMRNGELRDFNSFSGGERGRIEYSMILALQYMINSTNKYGGLQFLSTDEIVEGIDSLGLNNVMKSLGVFIFPILVTTHVQNKDYNYILTVVKENGVSKILN